MMDSSPTISERALEELAEDYELGRITAHRAIEAGSSNLNFELDTPAGRRFLRINRGKPEGAVRYEVEAVDALADVGVKTPRPLSARRGNRYIAIGAHFAVLYPWVQGSHRSLGTVTPDDAREVGRALGHMHQVGRRLGSELRRPAVDTLAASAREIDTMRAARDDALRDATALCADELSWQLRRKRTQPCTGLIHADLFRDNVIFSASETTLIDFEQAGWGSLVDDVAITLNAWCYVEDYEPVLARQFLAGYCTERPLTAPEREELTAALRRGALYFAARRVTHIYLPRLVRPEKDFRRYLDRLRRLRDHGEVAAASWLQSIGPSS